MIQARINYEMFGESDIWDDDPSAPQLSPLERIELLKAKCKEVHKWIGEGLKTDLPEPGPAPELPEQNLFELNPILRTLYTYDALEELD